MTDQPILSRQHLDAWKAEGYVIASGLWSADEVDAVRQRFQQIGDDGQPIPGHFEPKPNANPQTAEPLERYPRVMHPHRFDDLSRRMLLHPRVGRALEQLLGEPAVAVQSMYYFKPPGARGQALHQDNLYLEVAPDTCYAAWVAIDPADPDNGGMYVVPGSHTMDILCPESADLNESFTSHLVNAPKGMKAAPARMQPGDVLFFNGSLIHGSGRNKTTDRWRRSFICHYMPASSTRISQHYFPVLNFDGEEVTYEQSQGGGPCGSDVKFKSYGQSFDPSTAPG